MSDLPKCLLCGCGPNESFDLFDMNIASYNCDTHDCPIAESGLSLTFDEWTALMGRGDALLKASAIREASETIILTRNKNPDQRSEEYNEGWDDAVDEYDQRLEEYAKRVVASNV